MSGHFCAQILCSQYIFIVPSLSRSSSELHFCKMCVRSTQGTTQKGQNTACLTACNSQFLRYTRVILSDDYECQLQNMCGTTYLVLLTTHFSTGKTLSRLFPERNHNLFVTAAVVARWKTSTNDVMDCPCKSAVLTLPKWESVECVGRFHDWLVVGHRNANISLTHIQNSRERPSVVPAHRFTFFAF